MHQDMNKFKITGEDTGHTATITGRIHVADTLFNRIAA